jgi:hypothetical protein
VYLANGDVGRYQAFDSNAPNTPVANANVQADTVAAFSCNGNDLRNQYTDATSFTGISSGINNETALPTIDKAARSYTAVVAKNKQPAQAGGRTPAQGQEPGSSTEFPAEGGGKTVRTYGPEGRAVTDVDYGHDHTGAGDPHVHDWDKKRPRQPPRAPKPGEIPEPSKSTTVNQQRPDLQTIIGATILAIGGTAILIMTGGGAALQRRAGGVVIVPCSGLGLVPTNSSEAPSSPYCT